MLVTSGSNSYMHSSFSGSVSASLSESGSSGYGFSLVSKESWYRRESVK